MEQSPTWPKGSPFIYTMSIQDRNTGADLPGEKLVDNIDSASYSKLEFAWAEDQLTVSETFDPGEHKIAVANFRNNKQGWTHALNP